MGALASVSHWLPQDDFLLKNAVEAGASLESLAKGAVQFSQRFTVQELQDRWYSLLYDPVVSAEASVRMIEFEHSTSNAKFNKEAKSISGKRKAESVRKCYSAMRKRICSEPFDLMDISFVGEQNPGKHGEPLSSDCFLGDEFSDLFGIQEPNFGVMHHPFPEFQATGASSSSEGVSTSPFCTGLQDNNEFTSLGQGSAPLNICPSFHDNVPLTGDQSIVKDLEHSEELQTCDLFESVDLDVQSSAIFDEIKDNEGNPCSGFENKVFNSSPPDCDTSLPDFCYSFPIPQMPTWSAGDTLTPSTLADVLGETKDHGGNDLVTPVDFDANDASIRGYNSLNSKSELKGQMPGDGMKGSVPNAEEYFAELSNSLLNFTPGDDMLFMDADGKDMIDTSYLENLSSLLLDSPDKIDNPDVGMSEVVIAPNECLCSSPSAAYPGESCDEGQYHCDDRRFIWRSEGQWLSSALTVNPAFPELRNGVICCTLNTEDPEIPNNDDVFLPIRLPSVSISSMTHTSFDGSYYPMLSSVEFSNGQNATDRALMKSKQSNYSQLHISSCMTESSSQLRLGFSHQSDDYQVKLEPLNNDPQHVALRKVTTCEGPALVNLAYSSKKNIVPWSEKELLTKNEQPKNLNHDSCDSHVEQDAQASDPHLKFQKNAAGNQQDIDGRSKIQNHEELRAEFCSAEKPAAKAIAIPTVPDQVELYSDSDDDDDVPYFSDVEAMILDMDLSPEDQEIYSSRGVLRYQHEDARRTIIRLEQAADAYLQRALAAHEAFAVLYGRRSKHFIMKTEVLLGRATEDVKVDIDLTMEGYANRISRRQATIKMDNHGSFHLTNHGKFSIYVNGKEVVLRETVGLVSGCLIEVRGVPFVFETNRRLIKQYLENSGN